MREITVVFLREMSKQILSVSGYLFIGERKNLNKLKYTNNNILGVIVYIVLSSFLLLKIKKNQIILKNNDN